MIGAQRVNRDEDDVGWRMPSDRTGGPAAGGGTWKGAADDREQG
jgi:hypothetical protein